MIRGASLHRPAPIRQRVNYCEKPVSGMGTVGPRILTAPMSCCHSLTPFDGCDKIEEASIVSGKFVVLGCDASEVYDLAKEAFDQIAVFVDYGVEAAPCGGCGSARHDGLRAVCDLIESGRPL